MTGPVGVVPALPEAPPDPLEPATLGAPADVAPAIALLPPKPAIPAPAALPALPPLSVVPAAPPLALDAGASVLPQAKTPNPDTNNNSATAYEFIINDIPCDSGHSMSSSREVFV